MPHPPQRLSTNLETLLELLQQQSEGRPDEPAYTFCSDEGARRTWSYRQLDERARAVAAELQRRTAPGDPVLLVFPAGLAFLEAFFGCVYAGRVAVPATVPKPRRPMPRLASIARDTAATAALTDRQTLALVEQNRHFEAFRSLSWIASDEIPSSEQSAWKRPDLGPDDLAFLQYTSGSTSEPRGVRISHRNLLHNLEMIRDGFGLVPDVRGQTGVFWLPAYHDMGLIGGILEPLYVAGHSVLMSPQSFLQRPLDWLKLLSEYRATVSGAPNFAYDLCVERTTPQQRSSLDLSHLQVAFCGAEPIRPETLERFAAAMAPSGFREQAFYPCYGAAEATLLITGQRTAGKPVVRSFRRAALEEGRAEKAGAGDADRTKRLVSCGGSLLDQEVKVVEPATGRLCEEGTVGEIWVRGPSVACGYWNRPELTESVFGARLTDDGSATFLRTGDLGFFDRGELFVSGRLKDVIIIRGRNHYPQDIEQTVSGVQHAWLAGSACAFSLAEGDEPGSETEQLVVVQELGRQQRDVDAEEIAREIRRAVAEVHELEVAVVVLVRYASLPRTTSGKIQRALCRQQYLSGALKTRQQWIVRLADSSETKRDDASQSSAELASIVGSVSASNALAQDQLAERLESWLIDWLRDRRGVAEQELSAERPFVEYGVDSMAAVELSQQLEEALHVRLTPVIAWNYPTPRKLARYLASEVSRPAETPASEAADAEHGDAAEDPFDQLVSELEALSDEEAEAALKREQDADSGFRGP